MDLVIGPSLLLNILADDPLIPIPAHRVCVESTGPELTTPQHLLDFGMGTKNFLCGDALDRLDDHCGRHGRDALDEEMDMVFVRPYLDEMNFMTFRYPHAYLLEGRLHRVREDLSPILSRADYVVEKERLVMPFEDMFTHILMLSHMGSGGNAFRKEATPQRSCEEFCD